jgi:hypothetical protein
MVDEKLSERSKELIGAGLAGLVNGNIQAVKLLMTELNNYDSERNGVKFLADQLNTLGSEMTVYEMDGINFPKGTLNNYKSVAKEIKVYLGGRK